VVIIISIRKITRGAEMMQRLDNKKYVYFALVGILIILVFIIYAFYGFSGFLTGIEDKEVAALLVVMLIVGIILTMLQRAGIIFADKQFY
jgi:uncharacterized membrane protein